MHGKRHWLQFYLNILQWCYTSVMACEITINLTVCLTADRKPNKIFKLHIPGFFFRTAINQWLMDSPHIWSVIFICISSNNVLWSEEIWFLQIHISLKEIDLLNDDTSPSGHFICLTQVKILLGSHFQKTLLSIEGTWISLLFYQPIEQIWTKWQAFCRQHFKLHLLHKNFGICIEFSLRFGPNHNNSSLVQWMNWCQTCDKPLPESALTKIYDMSSLGHKELMLPLGHLSWWVSFS